MSTSHNFTGPVLIIGGNGFLASHIIDRLIKANASCPKSENANAIHSLDMNITQNRWPSVTYHQANDVANKNWRRKWALNEYWWREELPKLLRQIKPTTVFHLAVPGLRETDAANFGPLMVDCTQCILKACKDAGVKAFVYTSMGRVMNWRDCEEKNRSFRPPDDMDLQIQLRENIPAWDRFEAYNQNKASSYCRASGQAEQLVTGWNRSGGDSAMLTVCIRPRTSFGDWPMSRQMAGTMANCLQASAFMQVGTSSGQKSGGNGVTWMDWMGELAQAQIELAQELHDSWGKGLTVSGVLDRDTDGLVVKYVYPRSFHFVENDDDEGSEAAVQADDDTVGSEGSVETVEFEEDYNYRPDSD